MKTLSDFGIVAECVLLGGGVKENNWPCIHYQIKYTKKASTTFDYYLGIGHVSWKDCDLRKHVDNPLATHTRQNRTFKHPEAVAPEQAAIAADLARWQKVFPDGMQVLNSVCRDAFDATQSTFEDWCDTFGYDVDSRKAEKIYNECRNLYPRLLAILTACEIREISEMEF